MEQIGPYRITRLIEEGGVAVVYQAMQESLNRPVALKVLQHRFSEDPRVVDYFNRESLIIARLIHPNIIHVIDRGLTGDNRPYFAMDYIDGTNTARMIMDGGLTFPRKLDIVIQTCKALAYAHKNGVIHRDIKPANILLDTEGNALVTDFGIAQFYDGGSPPGTVGKAEVLGTPTYMSPEQRENSRNVTFASDIYSLGVVMAELFSGKRFPKSRELPSPLGPDVPAPLERIIRQCLNHDPEKRPASADLIRNELLTLSQGVHIDPSRRKKAPSMTEIFSILDIIRETENGATYLIRHREKDQLMIAKTFPPVPGAVKTARLLMNLRHDGIVWIQGVSGNETSSLVVMEYLPGGSLEDRMVMPQPLHEALRVTTAVSRALSFAHTNRIVHGNLKPSNVLFTGTDRVKVADFGMNRGDAESTLLSPEGVCEDIFSMGRLLYHMVVGFEPVFKADGGFAPHKQFKNLPSEVKSQILRMLSRNTETGYRSMAQVLADLEGIYRPDTDSDRTVLNLDESLSLMARKTLQKSVMTVKRWWVAGVILLGVAALVALGITLLK